MAYHFAEQFVLALEVVIQRLPGDLRACGDAVDADLIAFFSKRFAGGLEEALAGALGGVDDGNHADRYKK